MTKADMSTITPVLAGIILLLPLISAIITISYLGLTFSEHDIVLHTDDWRRKWLIFFAWLYIIIFVIVILNQTMMTK